MSWANIAKKALTESVEKQVQKCPEIIAKENDNTTNLVTEKYEWWLDGFIYHPGWDFFCNRYYRHFININNMINTFCYKRILTMYEYGDACKFGRFVADSNIDLLVSFINKANAHYSKIYSRQIKQIKGSDKGDFDTITLSDEDDDIDEIN